MFLVAEKDEQIIGGLAAIKGTLLRNDDPYALEHFWHILPDHRGKGIGTGLLDCFESWAQSVGAKHIFVGSEHQKTDGKADAIFEEYGYEFHEKSYAKEIGDS